MSDVDLKLPGVSFYARTGKWAARINEAGVRKHLGYFGTQEEAHAAYLEAKAAKAAPSKKVPQARPRAAGPISPEMMAALFSPSFIGIYLGDYGQDETFQEAATIVAEVSRSEGVSSWVASEVFAANPFDMRTLEFLPVETFRERVRLLRRLGLMDRVPEIADRVFKHEDSPTFEDAAHEIAFGDLV
jgi:hypothetical protein